MADHPRWESASAELPDPDDGDFDTSYEYTTNEEEDPTEFTKPTTTTTTKMEKKTVEEAIPQYILGTLVVRVVAARDLEAAVHKGGIGGLAVFRGKGSSSSSASGKHKGGTANPYASVKFGNSTQRTSEVYDTLDPVWPRQEAMFMDVSLPVGQISHPDTAGTATSYEPTETASMDTTQPKEYEQPPPTILTIGLFHAAEMGRAHKFAKGLVHGDSNDMFLGMASIDLQRLLTGRDHTFDGWLQLSGTESSRGYVRLVCEYEPSDPAPRPGDYCRFTRYCRPKDLYPLQVGRQYRIAKVDGDIVLISYSTSEGWVCSFQAHRFMLICEERHHSTVEVAQDEFASVAERLAHSPLVHSIAQTMERVAVDGILSVGEEIARGGVGLINRWFSGGVETVVSDVADVINWDGRHNPDVAEDLDLPTLRSFSHDGDEEGRNGSTPEDHDDRMDSKPRAINQLALHAAEPEALPNMPACPITGFPMVDPVVAADGHTYERSAIARWLATSNKSPMTGSILPHKELVTNYGLVSSVQEAAAARVASLKSSDSLSRMDIPRKIEVDESASVTPSGLFSLDGMETVTVTPTAAEYAQTPDSVNADEDDDDQLQ